jgi:ABC-type lipoprotein export system ATPase subunit
MTENDDLAEEDLDISWIAEQERFQNIQNNYQREPMDSMDLYFMYINKNQYIDKILTEKFVFDTSNTSIKSDQLLKIIQDKKIQTPFSKYKLIDILTFLVDLEPENIQSYSNIENTDSTYSHFFKVLNIPNEIHIPQSIFIFHNINSIYFIFQEYELVKKHNITAVKSILKPKEREPGSLKTAKKVRITSPIDKKQSKRVRNNNNTKRKLIHKNDINE